MDVASQAHSYKDYSWGLENSNTQKYKNYWLITKSINKMLILYEILILE